MNRRLFFNIDKDIYSKLVAALDLTSGSDAWELYANGYYKAAELLVERLTTDRVLRVTEMDSFVYPIIFLYRQHLELGIKHLIRKYNDFLETEREPQKTHNLRELRKTCETLLRECAERTDFLDLDNDAVLEVAACVEYFSSFDPNSTRFRYPNDADSADTEPSFLSISGIAAIMRTIAAILDGYSMTMDAWYEARITEYEGEQTLLSDELE